MEIELRHLRAICAIAETGSVTKAATSLGLAQPALTAQLQRIERALGGPLFVRDRHGARPTPLGDLVLARARVLLPAVQGLQDEAARLVGAGGSASLRYRIGATNGPIVGGLVHRLSAAYPGAHIATHASWSADELSTMVLADLLDYALVGVCGETVPSAGSGLAWHVVGVDTVVLLLPARHPLAGRAEVNLAELSDAQWAVARGDGCFGDCFAEVCTDAGFTPRTMFETDVNGALDLIETGAAVGLCQGSFHEMPGLAKVPIAGDPMRWRHLLGWQPDGVAATFGDQVLAHAIAAYADRRAAAVHGGRG